MAGIFGMFKRYEVHLSPAVQGRLLLNGQPVVNAEVYRTLDYDKEYVDKTRSDNKGHFSFPAKHIRSARPGKLFDETRVRQVVGVIFKGENYLLWYTVLDGINAQKAVSEKLYALNCDLENPEQEHVFANHENPKFPHSTFSICRWKTD